MAARRALAVFPAFLVAAWCGWASAFRPGTRDAKPAWFASLAAVLLVGLAAYLGRTGHGLPGRFAFSWHIGPAPSSWPRPGREGTRKVLAGTAPWLAVAVVVLAWEVLGIDTGTNEPHMTISALASELRPVRAAMLFVWMGVGVCFVVARGRASPGPPGRGHGRPGTGPRPVATPGAAFGAGHLARDVVPLLGLLEGRSRAVGVAFWVAMLTCAAGIEVLARRSAGRIADFDELLRLVSRPPAVRLLLVVAWTYAGWHLFSH